MRQYGTVRELCERNYDEKVRERFAASLEMARAEVRYGVSDPRYLDAVDKYYKAAKVVDDLRGTVA